MPSELIPAATIILVREKKKALEVYLIKRSTKSRFMGGLYVFPGGMVDPDDIGFNTWEPLYETAMEIDILDRPHKVLAPDHSFSRVWNDKGHWKPIEI